MRCLALLLVACVHPVAPAVPIVRGMGVVDHPIQTSAPEAQRHFNAGLALAYGFNYDEAAYEFRVAMHADPACAMCAWGYAYVLGPDINDPLRQAPGAYEAATLAVKLAVSAPERTLTRALLARLEAKPAMDFDVRAKFNEAYLVAMRAAAAAAPSDDDVATLLAEALMFATPPMQPNWNKDGTPLSPRIEEARQLLERVLARSPNHIGAIHFYIHLVDGGPHLAKALPHAERLGTLAPGAGHLVHMPSHLYFKLGRYAEAEDVNRRAIEADRVHLDSAMAGMEYRMFTMHPVHYLWGVLLWEGASAEALKQAAALTAKHEAMGMNDPGMTDMSAMIDATTAARFGLWDRALALPASRGPMSGVMLGFARGLAFVAKGELDEADKAVEQIRAASVEAPGGAPPMPEPSGPQPKEEHANHGPPMGPPPLMMKKQTEYVRAFGEAAAAQLTGAIAAARGDSKRAIEELRRAVELDDKVPDMGELSEFPIPARQRLGAVLLAAGDAAQAEAVYRAELAAHPENGWSLFGIAKALEAQKKPESKAAWERFAAAWKRADIKLTASVL